MPSLVFPSQVRSQVLDQHVELRALLERAVAHVESPLALDAALTGAIVQEVSRCFLAHLAFEDEALKPVFAVLDAWGPERVRELDTDHARQRQQLVGLVAKLEAKADAADVAEALRGLVADLLRDMEEEEGGCLQASEMSSGCLTVVRR